MKVLTLLLALVVLYAGLHFGSTTAGGADSYGYVSEAGLFLNRHLTIQQDVMRQSPWPNAADTWAPLGYRASPHQADAIVPLYAPGLPMLMALAQVVGGFCAAFVVVPICGALAVWATYLLGQQLFGRASISAGAALMVATSPIFLYQLMNPMTDVPVTAAWTLAVVLAASGWAAAAGAAAGVALVIRPNLAPVAIAIGAWLVVTRRHPVRFAAAVAPFAILIGALNASMYESALVSGYGTLEDLYAWSNVAVNARQFSVWTLSTQTPLVLLALLYIVMPRWFPESRVPYPRVLLVAVAGAVKVSYLFYQPFDAWWYLRFLLPIWPILMVLTVAGVVVLAERFARRAAKALAFAIVLMLALNGVRVALDRFAFDVGRTERRYLDVARFIESHTDRRAVILAVQHSGTIRMYAERQTLRFDQLDPAWLDRALAFLQANGRHPYLVVEAGEEASFRTRFGASGLGVIDRPPLGRLEGAQVSVYDTVIGTEPMTPLAIANAASRRTGWRCDPPNVWPPPSRME